MLNIRTKRLCIIPLDHELLKLYHEQPHALLQLLQLKPSLPLIRSSFKAQMDVAMKERWLPDTLAYPDLYTWYTNSLIVHSKDRLVLGTTGLGGYPNDHGETTIGYMIGEQYTGKGYATEALTSMINWAFAFSALQVIRADASRSNLASQRVLAKAGFELTHADKNDNYYQLTRKQVQQLIIKH
ncbi:GNAT family N-acetyltransferase [Mucilaginibacter daejeonensis]|uniref:GNAT family N-acetyltransferase n=1 Tax=Mucilaginibacter daejeonensis TaxID=398049 RepID=UPI001D1738FA|nr:GNAT family N-acetyltransferase [Mucilaginibacter daejeonensis]UEG52697.1 GNAT family N-acetyltransferase [Mucilaginibacter daejeonensis]